MTGSDLKTAAEAATRLGVSVPTVQRWADDGVMAFRRKAPLLFDGAEVERRAAEIATELRERLAHLETQAAAS